MEDYPTQTRESDLDHEFKVSVFDYMMDQAAQGALTQEEAFAAYHEVMGDIRTQDGPTTPQLPS